MNCLPRRAESLAKSLGPPRIAVALAAAGHTPCLHRSRDAGEDAVERLVESVECHQQNGNRRSANHTVFQGGDALLVGDYPLQESENVWKHDQSLSLLECRPQPGLLSSMLELGRT